jgi:hypothetical protein
MTTASVLDAGPCSVSLVFLCGNLTTGHRRAAIASSELVGANIAPAVAKRPIREFNSWYVHLWLSLTLAQTWMTSEFREFACVEALLKKFAQTQNARSLVLIRSGRYSRDAQFGWDKARLYKTLRLAA